MSKKYNTNFIKEYINEHKDEIEFVECGMREDWRYTAATVYENGEFDNSFDWDSRHLFILGIDGSIWATPVMCLHLKRGDKEIVECYVDDGEYTSQIHIVRDKSFAAKTGGCDMLR